MKRFLFSSLLVCSCIANVARAESPVTQEARAFRISIYNQFRHDRETYNRLRGMEELLAKQWSDAGRPEAHATTVADWYRTARLSVLNGNAINPLPDMAPLLAEKQQKQQTREVNYSKHAVPKQEIVISAASPEAVVQSIVAGRTESTITSSPELNSTTEPAATPTATVAVTTENVSVTHNHIAKSITRALWKAATTE